MAKVFHICQEINGRQVPVNGNCDNFNYITGCLGHDQPDIIEHKQATNAADVFIYSQSLDIENSDNVRHNNATMCATDAEYFDADEEPGDSCYECGSQNIVHTLTFGPAYCRDCGEHF